MAAKPADYGDISHNEKAAIEAGQPDLSETAGRRKSSVALNIVENPLKVSLATSAFRHPPLLRR